MIFYNFFKEKGFNDTEIQEIKKSNIKDKIKKRALLENSTLKNMGYSDMQISMLKNYDGSDSQARLLSATLTASISKNSAYYNSSENRTYFVLDFSWSWSYEPYYKYTDIVGIGYQTSRNNSFIDLNKSFQDVKYYDPIGNHWYTRTFRFTQEAAKNTGECRFWMIQSPAQSGGLYAHVAKNGSGKAYVFAYDNVEFSRISFKYGHTTTSVTPSISISYPYSIGLGFGFSKSVDIEYKNTLDIYNN